ncbi:autotransporter domain-containing protein [Mesorhizobium sp.]|uniref:autotransporter domain-containing protein n=1 Tax=Mesorhizobium sp. TaxID=1871066 RepID=UPI0025F8AD70|nr:autotransporter domain-containing protein [Mesorhizobium sp.]
MVPNRHSARKSHRTSLQSNSSAALPKTMAGCDDMPAPGEMIVISGDCMPQGRSGRSKATSTAPTSCLKPLRDPRYSVSSLALMLGAVGLAATALPAVAADVTWNGSTSGDWFDLGNWTPGAVPDATNFVNVNTMTPNPTVVGGGAANGLVVFVGRNAGDVGSLKITNGGTLTDSQGSVGRFAGSTGTVTVDGVGSAWLHADDFYIGAQGTGLVSILNGGLISNVRGILGDGDDAFGLMSVDGAGSTWSNSSTLTVGQNGPGVLNVSNGGTVTDTDGSIGKGSASNGSVSIDGAGSTWTNSGSLTVGDAGTGNLTITNGGAVSNDMAYVGNQAGSTGLASIDGAGSTWTSASDLYVGNSGIGNVSILNGGAVSNDNGVVGAKASSTGKVFVDGAGSTWINNSNLVIGQDGDGALVITKGGVVSSANAFVGFAAGSSGSIAVDGAGSALAGGYLLAVGGSGTGMLSLSHGGTVSNTNGTIGVQAGSSGKATVTGMGSTWTNSADLIVGEQGTGTLTISNGGAVSNAQGYVGKFSGSSGVVTVDGMGSKWTNSGDLHVGEAGTGTLHISNGGAVSDVNALVAYDVDSSGAVTVDGLGSTWTSSGYLGVQGNGTLAVTQGGTVISSDANVGSAPGTTGTATIDGVGSNWTIANGLILGVAGNGVLAVSNGGLVSDVDGFVGYYSGSSALVTVDGSGSKWANSGDLKILSAGMVSITNGGEITDTNGVIGTSAGEIGTVTIDGAGSKWTNGANLYVGNAGSGTLAVSKGGAVSVAGNLFIADQAGSVGTVNIGGAAGSAAAAAGTVTAAGIQFGAGTGKLNFNHTETNYGFASDIGGVGMINQLAGVTKLTGNSSGFTGTTNVSGGGLYVNGSLGGVINVTGGLLGGSGTVGNVTIASGGSFAPGNSIGTINVANTTFSAGSVYSVEVESGGTSDLINAAGTVTINGGAVDVIAYPDYALGTTYTIVTAAGGVTGSFDSASFAGTIFIAPTLTYDANNVYLDLVELTFADLGLTANQKAAAAGAESLGAGNALYDAIYALGTEAEARAAYDAVSGEIHASAKGMLLEDSRFLRDAATNRVSDAFGEAGAAALPVMAYGEGGPEMVAADTDRFAVWGQAFGSWGDTGSDGNAAAFDRSTGGVLAGADGLVGDWRVGLLGGYSHSSFDADARNSSGNVDSYHAGLYGGTNWGAIAFRTGAAYSWNRLATKRSVAFSGFADQLSADYDAGTAQVFGELAYKMDASRFHFEPFAALAYVDVKTDGFTEQGGAAALVSQGSNSDATFTTLGLRVSTDLRVGGIEATAHGTLGWRHAFGDAAPISTFALAGGDAFTIAGVPVAKDSVVIEAGFDLPMSANATLGLSYAGQFGSRITDNGAKAKLDVRF